MSDVDDWELLIAEALVRLERHPKGVAEALREEGVVGQLCSARACPVARYLNKALPEMGGFRVGVSAAVVAPWAARKQLWAELPLKVAQFVWDFDSGKYPELLERREGR